METEEIENIARMIKTTDWYYHYSDDYGVWARGEREANKVMNHVRSKDWTRDDYEKLINIFFKDTEKLFSNEEYLQSYKEDMTSKIQQLTGMS